MSSVEKRGRLTDDSLREEETQMLANQRQNDKACLPGQIVLSTRRENSPHAPRPPTQNLKNVCRQGIPL